MGKHKGFQRLLAMLVCCMLAFGMAVSLSACGGNHDEELIRSSIGEAFDVFKNPTADALKETFEGQDAEMEEVVALYESLGLDFYELCEHLFAHFDYTIDTVTVDGDTATADVTITTSELSGALTDATSELEDDVTNNIDTYSELMSGEDGTTKMYQILFEKVYERLDSENYVKTKEVQLHFTKTDGEWSVDDGDMNVFYDVLMGDMEV